MKNVGARIVTAAEPMEHTDASHGIWTNPERRLMRNGRGFNGNFSAVPGRLAGRERYRALRAAGGTAFFRCPESVAATRIFSWTLLRFDDRFLPAPLEGDVRLENSCNHQFFQVATQIKCSKGFQGGMVN
ncbi:uncharacterized protein PHA67_007229 isoform 4-T8 [Liasis olivaceus]